MSKLKVIFNKIFRRKQLKALHEEMEIRAEVRGDRAFVAASHPVLALQAKMLTEMYEDASKIAGFDNGVNFISVDVIDHASAKGYELTIQRWGRPSPSVVATNFRKALDAIIANPGDAVDIAVRALDANNYPVSAQSSKAE